jgi:hypothetical protein
MNVPAARLAADIGSKSSELTFSSNITVISWSSLLSLGPVQQGSFGEFDLNRFWQSGQR